jgi:hypothetical protein
MNCSFIDASSRSSSMPFILVVVIVELEHGRWR